MRNLLLYKELHKIDSNYGTKCHRFPRGFIEKYIEEWGIKSILDYGCGKTDNSSWYPVERFYRYDPAVEGIDFLPNIASVDLVTCTDVLEHIPEEELPFILYRIRSFSKRALFTIALFDETRRFPNGESYHCNLKKADEWIEILQNYWMATLVGRDELSNPHRMERVATVKCLA